MTCPSFSRLIASASLVVIAGLLTACGGGSGDNALSQPIPATTSATANTSTTTTTATGITAAIAAAKKAAASDPLCTPEKLGDFYWEIGSASDTVPLTSGSQGSGGITASSYFNIASASKWIFGAYTLEKKGIDLIRNDSSLNTGLRFTSGYTGFIDDACAGKLTIGSCYTSGMNSSNPQPDVNTTGLFDYESGHDQKLAVIDLGLGNFTAAQLDREYQNTLGLSKGFNMAGLDPLMAGGMMGTAGDYAQFLRKIMNRELLIGNYLGENAVCALASACPGKVAYSPILALNEPWTYSYNHWVESEHGNGSIDAYSSPGKWGFYPWISADKKYYGILSRHDQTPGAYVASVKCGRQIRKAFQAAL